MFYSLWNCSGSEDVSWLGPSCVAQGEFVFTWQTEIGPMLPRAPLNGVWVNESQDLIRPELSADSADQTLIPRVKGVFQWACDLPTGQPSEWEVLSLCWWIAGFTVKTNITQSKQSLLLYTLCVVGLFEGEVWHHSWPKQGQPHTSSHRSFFFCHNESVLAPRSDLGPLVKGHIWFDGPGLRLKLHTCDATTLRLQGGTV